MHFEIPILGFAIYLLFWDKLPNWGTWFMWVINHMPGPIRYLYQKWHCAFCSGFWIGLALHAATGQWFMPDLATLPGYWGPIDPLVGWFLDALAVAAVVFILKNFLDVLKAHTKLA